MEKLIETTICREHGSVKARFETTCTRHILHRYCAHIERDHEINFFVTPKIPSRLPDIDEILFLQIVKRFVYIAENQEKEEKKYCACYVIKSFEGAWNNRLDILSCVIFDSECDHTECFRAYPMLGEYRSCVRYRLINIFEVASKFLWDTFLFDPIRHKMQNNTDEELFIKRLEENYYRAPFCYRFEHYEHSIIDEYCIAKFFIPGGAFMNEFEPYKENVNEADEKRKARQYKQKILRLIEDDEDERNELYEFIKIEIIKK